MRQELLRLTGAVFALLALAGCDSPAVPEVDAAADAGHAGDAGLADDAGPERCASDEACDDGAFCNGVEECSPESPDADVRGCAAGAPPCEGVTSACDEDADACRCPAPDADGDGHDSVACGGSDCDDADANRFPGNAEICDDAGHDEDCDGETVGTRDVDGDGYTDAACCNGTTCADDCDDARASAHPSASEICNGRDDDCDTLVDDGVLVPAFVDGDGDGYGAGDAVEQCPGLPGYAMVAGDCDDAAPTRSPGSTELCADDVDNDCDSRVDESGPRLFFRDFDDDGYGDAGDSTMTAACDPPAGYAANSRDCNDASSAINPGVSVDPCDRLDNDCSLGIGSGGADFDEDRDRDGHAPLSATCTGGYPRDDCNDDRPDIFMGALELCDGVDNDCSGTTTLDPSEDVDGDRHSAVTAGCSGGPYPRNDCMDTNPTIHGGALELCDRLDNDCSSGGGVEPLEDADDDGHAPMTLACNGGPLPEDDCDDTRATVYPGAPELCDGRDTDCGSGGGAAQAEDMDADGHSPAAAACAGGYPKDDCRDDDATVYTGRSETCDRVDNDCSTGGGAEPLEDMDMDSRSPTDAACSGGYARSDCNDADPTIYTGASERCDRLDNNCSSGGGAEPLEDMDGDGHAPIGAACSGGSLPRDDCRDGDATIYPGAPELCDRLDNVCATGGGVRESEDVDDDMHAPIDAMCTGGARPRDDCDDANPLVHPGAPPPRPVLIGPANGALTGSLHATESLRPTFRWRVASCETHELEIDDSCSAADFASCSFPSAEIRQSGIVGARYTPSSPLAVSVTAPVGRRYYWRVRACEGGACGAWSPVRYVDVGRVPSDVDGDGYADLVVGADGAHARVVDDASDEYHGAVLVFRGGPSGPASPYTLRVDNPAAQRGAEFGGSLGTGDFNADGYADVAVGARGLSGAASEQGGVFIFEGGASGLAATPSGTVNAPVSEAGAWFGSAVAAVDVDSDGYADLIAGAPHQDSGALNEGSAFVFRGGAGGLSTTAALVIDSPTNQALAEFGASVASAGDVDGDGHADVVIGAPRHDASPGDDIGAAFVFYGGTAGLGLSAVTRVDNPGNRLDGEFGAAAVSAHDLDGDGYDEVLVTAPFNSWPTSTRYPGIAYLFFGGPAGIEPEAGLEVRNPLDNDGRFGDAVANLGDIDHDGYSDIAIGAPGQDIGLGRLGAVYVYLGGPTGYPSVPSLALDPPSGLVTGSGFGLSVESADFDGNGLPDLACGVTYPEGHVFLYEASAGGLPGTPSATFSQDEIGFGRAIAGM